MIRIQKWDKGFNIGILGFCIVDAWKLYKSAHAEQCMFLQGDFYDALSEALIDNKYDNAATLREYCPDSSSEEQSNSTKSASRSPSLVRTSKLRKIDSNYSNNAFQGRCGSCKRHKSIEVCSVCLKQGKFERYLCSNRSVWDCFAVHVKLEHKIMPFIAPVVTTIPYGSRVCLAFSGRVFPSLVKGVRHLLLK